MTDYEKKSLTLTGTGVMIGAGIFALTGQIAVLAGPSFPWVFAVAAVVTGFSAYSYVKLSNAFDCTTASTRMTMIRNGLMCLR